MYLKMIIQTFYIILQSKLFKIKYLTLATTVALSAEVNEVKNKTPNTTILANTNVLTALKIKYLIYKNKITTDHDHGKYITTQEFSKLTVDNFTARLAQVKMII